ncbi:DUF4194 domain-containing protein [Ralstonia nicotianae]|uniref:DUF4194 domain-containing protein n=1 Tax=Ralstonia nicotianae TaxID=3037696 RepID=A0ABX7ZNQ1_9RALS|nr:DUF4194 domain-containing protein [Ralstonia nicotianae]QUP57073.1 DUF4194 domain-containing protein [Ralstonia nicotianae]
MNSWTDEADAAGNGATSSHTAAVVEERKEEAIFLGDTGSLPIDTRRVLVQLLLGPSVDARRQTKLWPVLLRDETVIRSRMHELFLEVVIDHEQQVAFTRQVTSEELEVPILLRKASLTFLETALLLFLRQRLTQADAQGERAVVSLSDMQEHLGVFERDNNPDHAKFGRQVVNAVDKAKKLSLLQRIRSSEERYEVAPTLKLLFSAEEIQQLSRTYGQLAQVPQPTGEPDDSVAVDVAGDSADEDEEGL